jgi:hypothetical protein
MVDPSNYTMNDPGIYTMERSWAVLSFYYKFYYKPEDRNKTCKDGTHIRKYITLILDFLQLLINILNRDIYAQ